MLSRVNSMVWSKDDEQTSSWDQNNTIQNDAVLLNRNNQEMEIGELSTFNSILEAENEDWYISGGATHHNQTAAAAMHDLSFSPSFTEAAAAAAADINNQQMFLHSVDSSASCSPNSAVFNNGVVFNNNLDPSQVNYFLQQKTNPNPSPLQGSYDVGNSEYLESAMNFGCGLNSQMGTLMTNFRPGFSSGFGPIQPDPNPLMLLNNRCNKILKPLDHNFGAAQPTLFQKRAALRKNLGAELETTSSHHQAGVKMVNNAEGGLVKKGSCSGDDVEDVITVDGGYDSDDQFLMENKSGGGDHKGKKKKGMPAKNLMAERRRRKKLNDRLYMLRSVVPKISKMDRASILGDAIDYLKELLQKINELHNELETTPTPTPTPTPTSLYSISTPSTPVGLIPTPIKQELAFPTPLSSPTAGQPPARVEVRVREGRAVNIHMFCARKPGLLLSTLRAIDNLGLDIQQAVISSFNAFALDIFRAEQWEESQEVNPDHIKAVLLDSAGFHGMQL